MRFAADQRLAALRSKPNLGAGSASPRRGYEQKTFSRPTYIKFQIQAYKPRRIDPPCGPGAVSKLYAK